jgi:hypothetical protein
VVAPPADGTPPEVRARELMKKQLALLPDGKNAELLAMFAPGAVVLVPDARPVDVSLDLVSRIALLNPHATLVSATITDMEVGSAPGAIWFDAELAIVVTSSEEGRPAHRIPHTVRAVELLDGASGWKVAVASFAETRKAAKGSTTPGEVPAPTAAGPLAALLADPKQIAEALPEDPSPFVLGTEAGERAIGQANALLLATKWGKLKFELEAKDKVHEVHTAAWGYAIGNVNLTVPKDIPCRMSGLVLAIPKAPDGWTIVGVVYDAI